MRFSRSLKLIALTVSFCAFITRLSLADNDPQALALLQKVTDAYKNASSFSCEGQYENAMQTARPLKLMGAFKIRFARPEKIRIDWTDTQMGGAVTTSSIFTQDKTIYFYWEMMGKWAPQKDIETALGGAAGISHGISYGIPSLLCGQKGYLNFASLKPLENAVVDGMKCLILSGTTRFQGEMEIAVDPDTYAIRRIKSTQTVKTKDLQQKVEKARKEAAKSNPEIGSRIPDVPVMPDFVSVNITTYKDPVFGKEPAAEDFVYPVPAAAKKVDDILK
jgi:hypothetical protein